MADLLNVEHLSVSFFTPAGEVQAVRDVSFSLKAGEVLAIVGESGCGKSVLCKSILRLLPQTAKIKSGKIIVDGTDITAYREREMTALRGSLFSMVFQDPMTALDPTMTIGAQIAEAVLAHKPKLEKPPCESASSNCWSLSASTARKSAWLSIPTTFPVGCASAWCWPSRLRGIRTFYLPTSRRPRWM